MIDKTDDTNTVKFGDIRTSRNMMIGQCYDADI